MDMTAVLNTVLLCGCLALLTYCAHKMRRIHLKTFELLAAAQREGQIVFSQLQALSALERKLNLPQPLPATRGWAGSPDFLLSITEHMLRHRPQVVMECSSGVSTVAIARCLQINGGGHVYSLENTPEFAARTRDMLATQGLQAFATVIDAPLVSGLTDTPWYDLSRLPAEVSGAALLVVDGPPGHVAAQSRYPALPQLMPHLAQHCTVMLDDADRPDERVIVQRWLRQYPAFRHTYIAHEKGLSVLTNP